MTITFTIPIIHLCCIFFWNSRYTVFFPLTIWNSINQIKMQLKMPTPQQMRLGTSQIIFILGFLFIPIFPPFFKPNIGNIYIMCFTWAYNSNCMPWGWWHNRQLGHESPGPSWRRCNFVAWVVRSVYYILYCGWVFIGFWNLWVRLIRPLRTTKNMNDFMYFW